MIDKKLREIEKFCVKNSNQENIENLSRYFKNGFSGYGIDQKTFELQKNSWIANWKKEMTLDLYLDLGDKLIQSGKYEEISFAISFLKSERASYTESTFDRISNWFDLGISNWGNTDVLCIFVLSSFFIDKILPVDKLNEWTSSNSEWKRRAVPVTLAELLKKNIKPEIALPIIEPLMPDDSEYVQKGVGTLLRGLWKNHPSVIEKFLQKWKDQCGRLIIQYATEKMDVHRRNKFKKTK
jgi:3-methyladenine DNA glycosylase AlkD